MDTSKDNNEMTKNQREATETKAAKDKARREKSADFFFEGALEKELPVVVAISLLVISSDRCSVRMSVGRIISGIISSIVVVIVEGSGCIEWTDEMC